MGPLPRRTTRQDRRLVLIMLVIACATSTLTMLAIRTDFAGCCSSSPAVSAIIVGIVAAGRARVAEGGAFLGERIVRDAGHLAWTRRAYALDSYTLLFGGGHSAARGRDLASRRNMGLGRAWYWGVRREATVRTRGGACAASPAGAVRGVPKGWLVLVLASAAALAVWRRCCSSCGSRADCCRCALGGGWSAAAQRGFPPACALVRGAACS